MKSLDAGKNVLHIRTIFFVVQSRRKKRYFGYFKTLQATSFYFNAEKQIELCGMKYFDFFQSQLLWFAIGLVLDENRTEVE